MRIALIADAYPPLRTSGAVQLRDLSIEWARQGHEVTVMVATPELGVPWRLETRQGVLVARLKTMKTKDVGYVRRTVGEFLMPLLMRWRLRSSPLKNQRWDAVVWYSPTIFLGPLVKALKKVSGCRSYLILRDIFPAWAVDMGLMGRGLPYLFFKAIENYQYAVADVIGVQTEGNRSYFGKCSRRIEVLQNWLADTPNRGCSIAVDQTPLAGRMLFVYAGNMGIAQGMGVLMDLAQALKERADIGFLFVGRGSDAPRLREQANACGLNNVLFFDEIDPDEIPGLYAQCHVGLVALDPRNKTHNIPGKFLSYMQAGLPVLASINPGNDLVALIESEAVGYVCTDASVQTLKELAVQMIDTLAKDADCAQRCKALSAKLFTPTVAARQIVAALETIQEQRVQPVAAN